MDRIDTSDRLMIEGDGADGHCMYEAGLDDLDRAFSLIAAGDLATASLLVDRVLVNDPNHPYGLLAWGQILLARGDVDGAVDAHDAAVRFAPIDSHVHFALADSLRGRALKESPYFRAATWARARTAAEQGLYLAPADERGRALLVEILEHELADTDLTRDETPPDMLPTDQPRHLEVRAPHLTNTPVPTYLALVTTTVFWRSIWWVAPTLLFLAWLLWSWIASAFTWVNLAATALLLYGTLLVFRVWLGPRIEQRRRQVEF